MEYGGITPVGLPEAWRVLVDAACLDIEAAVIGSGVRRSKLLVPGPAARRAAGRRGARRPGPLTGVQRLVSPLVGPPARHPPCCHGSDGPRGGGAPAAAPGCGDGWSSTSRPPAPDGLEGTGSFRCPDPHDRPREAVVDDGSDTLPAGARAARLCLPTTTRVDAAAGASPPVSTTWSASSTPSGPPPGARRRRAAASALRRGPWSSATTTASAPSAATTGLLGPAGRRHPACSGSRNVYDAYLARLLRQRHAQSRTRTGGPHRDAHPAGLPRPGSRPATRSAAQPPRRAGPWRPRAGGPSTTRPPPARQLAALRHDIVPPRPAGTAAPRAVAGAVETDLRAADGPRRLG